MLSQSHLSPFPLSVQPVLWEFDGALRLFPQPDLLVIGDPGSVQDVTVCDTRNVLRMLSLVHLSRTKGYAIECTGWSMRTFTSFVTAQFCGIALIMLFCHFIS
jgi:hypothetical protein